MSCACWHAVVSSHPEPQTDTLHGSCSHSAQVGQLACVELVVLDVLVVVEVSHVPQSSVSGQLPLGIVPQVAPSAMQVVGVQQVPYSGRGKTFSLMQILLQQSKPLFH